MLRRLEDAERDIFGGDLEREADGPRDDAPPLGEPLDAEERLIGRARATPSRRSWT